MTNRVQDLIIQVWSDAGKAWGSAENKRRIISERLADTRDERDALPEGPEKDAKGFEMQAWQNALTRARWETRFLNSKLRPMIQRCFDTTPDAYQLTPWVQIRCRTVETFTGELCENCKQLEASFSPNDEDLREATNPWHLQLSKLFQALIADAYKIAGAGLYLQEQMDLLKADPEFATGYDETFRQWDRFVAYGVNYNTYGRGCFAETEMALGSSVDHLQGRAQETNVDIIEDKYLSNDNDTMKSVGGLYVLNAELLCAGCAGNREDDPIDFR